MQPEATKDGNLGQAPQDQRLRVGVGVTAVGIVLAVLLVELGAPPALRLVLLVPFFFGAAFVYMGLYGTCTGLAAQGLRDIGDGAERIRSGDELMRVQRQAHRVIAYAAITAILATGLFLLIP